MLTRLAALLPLAPLFACAHPGRPVPAPFQQTSLGSPDAFGSGIVATNRRVVTVALTAPAHLAVIRVFAGDSAQLAYPLSRSARGARDPLKPGAQRLLLPVQRVQVVVPDLLSRNTSGSGDDNACRMRRKAYEASRPRDTLNPRPATPWWEPCYSRPNHLEVTPATRTVPGSAIAPDPHYLVVIATDARLDPAAMTDRLNALDLSRLSGDAAARLVPTYLFGDTARWTAWLVYQP